MTCLKSAPFFPACDSAFSSELSMTIWSRKAAFVNALSALFRSLSFSLSWARRIADEPDAGAAAALLKSFPYYANYEELTRLEIGALLSARPELPRKVAFIGAGPLPLTSLQLLWAIASGSLPGTSEERRGGRGLSLLRAAAVDKSPIPVPVPAPVEEVKPAEAPAAEPAPAPEAAPEVVPATTVSHCTRDDTSRL